MKKRSTRLVTTWLVLGGILLSVLGGLQAPAQSGPKKPAKPAPSTSAPSPAAPAAPSAPASPEANPEPSPAPPTPPAANPGQPQIGEATAALAKAQTLLEFYFMETGSYPDTIEDMLAQYNQGVRQNEPMVSVPTDPATGKKLVYAPNEDRSGYVLRVPTPASYGLDNLAIRQLNWGWMASLAAEQRKKRLTYTCARYQELLVGVLNQYNKENRNKYPEKLEDLIPKLIQKLPTCPVAKKPYVYTHDNRGFEVGCPDPKAHGLEIFRFSSTEGPKRYP